MDRLLGLVFSSKVGNSIGEFHYYLFNVEQITKTDRIRVSRSMQTRFIITESGGTKANSAPH